VLAKGRGGERPGLHDKVVVAFTGWTAEGALIDR
jgi:hypothetical protein